MTRGLHLTQIRILMTVMNSICIHLIANGLNIYMYRRGEYIKNPLEKYNNRKG
jgi:hypothetical protein